MLALSHRIATFVSACCLAVLVGGCASGQKPAPAANEPMALHVYDVRDLIIAIPDFDDAPEWNLSTGGLTSPATRPAGLFKASKDTPTRQQAIDDLIATLRREPLPGVDGSSIRELSGQLIIKTTPAGHERVTQALDALREKRNTQITVEARFISVDPAEFEKPGAISKEELAEWKRLTGAGRAATDGPMSLSELQVAELLRFVQAHGQQTTLVTSPRITLFNGQRAYVLTAEQRSFVSDYTEKTADGKATYEPVIDTASAGVIMDVRATASSDRKNVTLDLRPQISRFIEIQSSPWPRRPAGSDLTIQQPKLDVSEIRATLSVGNNATLLLTGLRDVGEKDVNAPATRPAGERTVLLLVKPTILPAPAPDQTKSFPLLTTKAPE